MGRKNGGSVWITSSLQGAEARTSAASGLVNLVFYRQTGFPSAKIRSATTKLAVASARLLGLDPSNKQDMLNKVGSDSIHGVSFSRHQNWASKGKALLSRVDRDLHNSSDYTQPHSIIANYFVGRGVICRYSGEGFEWFLGHQTCPSFWFSFIHPCLCFRNMGQTHDWTFVDHIIGTG